MRELEWPTVELQSDLEHVERAHDFPRAGSSVPSACAKTGRGSATEESRHARTGRENRAGVSKVVVECAEKGHVIEVVEYQVAAERVMTGKGRTAVGSSMVREEMAEDYSRPVSSTVFPL